MADPVKDYAAIVGVAERIGAFFAKSGVGVGALTVTVSIMDEAGNLDVSAETATADTITGFYYYSFTADTAGRWRGKFVTAGDVDQKELPFEIMVAEASEYTATRAGKLDNLDVAVSTRSGGNSYTVVR